MKDRNNKRGFGDVAEMKKDDKYDEDVKKLCPICFMVWKMKYFAQGTCGHGVCVGCAQKFYDQKCPICRGNFSHCREEDWTPEKNDQWDIEMGFDSQSYPGISDSNKSSIGMSDIS